MCLEEMLECEIEKGYLYYGEIRRRIEVWLDEKTFLIIPVKFNNITYPADSKRRGKYRHPPGYDNIPSLFR